MKNLSCLIFAFLGSLLLHIPNVSAGPADAYADSCKWKYKKPMCATCTIYTIRCLTQKGRILSDGGSVLGVINNNYTRYRDTYDYRYSGVYTTKYQQVNQSNTLIEYECRSDGNGNCTGESTKTLYQYMGE